MSSNKIHNVAIVGAAGTVGSYITNALLASSHPFKITALTRKEGGHTFPKGVAVAEIDYDDEDTVVAALKGQDALVISLAIQAPPTVQSVLFRAAAKAGVEWVLPNEYTFDFDDKLNHAQAEDSVGTYKAKAAARKEIESLGKSKWIGLAHGFWYEFSLVSRDFESFGFVIDKKEAVIVGSGDVKLKATTWLKVGEAVEKILSLDVEGPAPSLSSYANKAVSFSSFYVSQNDILESILRVTGDKKDDWKIKYVDERAWLNESVGLFETNPGLAFGRALYSRHFFKDQVEFGEKYKQGDNELLGLSKEDLDTATKRGVELSKSGYKYL